MAEQINPREYRDVARFVEETSLDALTAYSEITFTPAIGDLQYFPQPAPDMRAAERGFALLHQQVGEVVAILHALATAAEKKLPIPTVLVVRVRPYVEAFRNRDRPEQNGNRADAGGEDKPRPRKNK